MARRCARSPRRGMVGLRLGEVGGERSARRCKVNKYYDLVTSFTEYHWGQSFHFAPSSTEITGLNNNAYQISRGKVGTLEFHRIAPKGCNRLFSILQTASHGLVTGSREQIFTVTFVLGRKPLKESEI
ncbi:cycloartenol-C-24-methyltransferase 1-like [Panicum miliaceum]|uniref:Cycloartenol-C-24-methyltransferase 1-like n=1 Tax=Panicum miliaceum TaxID=4540 RepID=A0A3L6Q2Z7_PANMI|nr:cycloartenol-C-24-methyltransferase 1-like [Panicum miliaceum]